MSPVEPAPTAVVYLAVITEAAEHSGGGLLADVPRTVHDCPDYEDNLVLDLAAEVGAMLIVSNDTDLLSMSPWRGTPILTPPASPPRSMPCGAMRGEGAAENDRLRAADRSGQPEHPAPSGQKRPLLGSDMLVGPRDSRSLALVPVGTRSNAEAHCENFHEPFRRKRSEATDV
jgi:hypothetical protein